MGDQLFSLAGKKAIVTGGAQGLGRMIAAGLVEAGVTVCITSRKEDVVQAAASEMSKAGDCMGIAADLSSPEGVVQFVAAYRDKFSGLDILINNAGKSWGAPIERFPDKAWPSVMAINVQTPFTLVREFLPELEASASADDPARVINIGSAAGIALQPIEAYSYGASKAAVHQLSRQLAADLAMRHINVNAVIPGYFPSKMTGHLLGEGGKPDPALLAKIPAGRLGRAEDAVGAIIYLCSRAGAYVTGVELPVDGGVVGCR